MTGKKPTKSWYRTHLRHAELSLTRHELALVEILKKTDKFAITQPIKTRRDIAKKHLADMRESYVADYFNESISELLDV